MALVDGLLHHVAPVLEEVAWEGSHLVVEGLPIGEAVVVEELLSGLDVAHGLEEGFVVLD